VENHEQPEREVPAKDEHREFIADLFGGGARQTPDAQDEAPPEREDVADQTAEEEGREFFARLFGGPVATDDETA
jgi:hypothetical protein